MSQVLWFSPLCLVLELFSKILGSLTPTLEDSWMRLEILPFFSAVLEFLILLGGGEKKDETNIFSVRTEQPSSIRFLSFMLYRVLLSSA